MRSIHRSGRIGTRLRHATIALSIVAIGVLSLPLVTGAAAQYASASRTPVQARVLTPLAGERTSSGFNVVVSLRAQSEEGNRLLSGYSSSFIDPTGPDGKGNPAFAPGASEAAPGLVVTLSTTPSIDDTPLVGPRTNLAGVFQINGVTMNDGMTRTWNDWQITSPGFFGENTTATLTVYAVRGTAPDAIPAGGLTPISNVVHKTFQIGS